MASRGVTSAQMTRVIVRGPLLAGMCTLIVAGMAPPSARAAVNYFGETAQDRDIKVRVGDDGLIDRVKLEWRAGCRRPNRYVQDSTKFLRPMDESTPTHFADTGSYRVRQPGGIRVRIEVAISGDLVAPDRWVGNFEARIAVRRHGHPHDRCSQRGMPWSATLEAG
jgi:hypothetical protein